MPESRKLRVFLCHASQDKPIVRELYQRLNAEGWIDPWLDEEKLLPGQDWDMEIEKAVETVDAVIVCLSSNSVTKDGYIQREIRFVLRIAEEKPEGTIFIIPLRLDDCLIPRRLRDLQNIDYFQEDRKNWAYGRLIQSLELRSNHLGISIAKISETLLPRQIKSHISRVKYLPDSIAYSPLPILVMAGIQFLKVSAGEFIMGNDRFSHKLEIPYDYYIGRYPITNFQYSIYLQANGEKVPRKKKANPAVGINWYQANKFVEWLNKEYESGLPVGHIFRLPSEAEWEKASRGTDGRRWPWGNEFDLGKCNTAESEIRSTTSVGTYSPDGDSPNGMADMVGNVWEWTCSTYADYPYDASDGRELDIGNRSLETKIVRRGGSFLTDHKKANCFYREYSSKFLMSTGFRIAIHPKS